MLEEPKAIVFGFRVMVEPRTRSRDLVEAVVRGRQVITVHIHFALTWFIIQIIFRMSFSLVCNVANAPTQRPLLVAQRCMLPLPMRTLLPLLR